MHVARFLLLALALAAAPAAAADAARATRHSGTVVSVDPRGGVIVMEEIGPWRVEEGTTVVTRRTIRLMPETKVNTFIRVDVPGRFAVELKPNGSHAETIVVRLVAMAERSGREAALRQCGGCEYWFRAALDERLGQLGLDAVELERRSLVRYREELGL